MIKNKLKGFLIALFKPIQNYIVPTISYTFHKEENNKQLSLLTIGWDQKLKNYWRARLLNNSSYRVNKKFIRIKHVKTYLNRIQNLFDIVIIESKYIGEEINTFSPVFMLPRWIEMIIDIEPSLKKSWSKETQRKIRKYSLDYEFRNTKEDFDLFYFKMYKPLIKQRHRDSAEVANYNSFLNKVLNKQAQLLFIIKDNEPIAAQLIEQVTDTYRISTFGILDGSEKIQKMGVHAALYFFAMTHFGKSGHKSLLCGSSMSIAFDGVTQFKMRMGAKPYLKDLKNRKKYYFLPLSLGSSVEKVLNDNPLIYLSNEILNVAYFHYSFEFSDKKEFLQQYKRINCGNINTINVFHSNHPELLNQWIQEEEIKNIKFIQNERGKKEYT